MKLSNFNYDLPPERIAQEPLECRDDSRLMVIDRNSRTFHHTLFSEIGDYLPQDSQLVLNDTKVIPARLIGNKSMSGGKVELLLINEKEHDTWEVLARPRRSLNVGTELVFGDSLLKAEVIDKPSNGNCIVNFTYEGDFYTVLSDVGIIPLPPYIRRPSNEEDKLRYQSVYATSEGAIAAPTAGLHFTTELLDQLKENGTDIAMLTLHVGIGTFQPVKVENIRTHKMHAEYINLPKSEAARIQTARDSGLKIVAVGTTVVRALETIGQSGKIKHFDGNSELFIYPGYVFKVVDILITNFHLPKSTLLMLVSAFADISLIQNAYEEALRHQYRFYSYGDVMLIL